MRGDGRCAYAERLRAISIHASPRGATVLAKNTIPCYPISIHAPPRGATRMRCASCKRTSFQFTPLREGRRLWFFWPAAALYFNSRPSARGDSTRYVSSPSQVFQFTPLREGRHFRGRRCASAGYFNSRPSARGDWVANASRHTRMLFQFTPLREGRRAGSCHPSAGENFNSRPSARGDTTISCPPL